MKIKIIKKTYQEIKAMPPEKHLKPLKQLVLLRWILKPICYVLLKLDGFVGCRKIGMEKLGPKEPCFILMNHSCFMDMKMVAYLLGNRPYHIVATLDSFVGLKWILRLLGCIPTKKFINDIHLIKDMHYAVKELKESVLMYPEAGYSFDGRATAIPESLGKCVKLLQVPVIMIRTKGAFHRNPLYNELRLRKVPVSATMEYILSPEEIKEKSVDEINAILAKQFTFDSFKEQQEEGLIIADETRAEGLQRLLYKCPHCEKEGVTKGTGTQLICEACGVAYELTETGFLKRVPTVLEETDEADNADAKFTHIPDWYDWQRNCVREELQAGTYQLELPVDIYVMRDSKGLYQIGEGVLSHTKEGFHLTGCDGELDYKHSPNTAHSLNADFYWYEIGDMICIGDDKLQYCCFPKNQVNIVAKTRMATEELYKMLRKPAKQA